MSVYIKSHYGDTEYRDIKSISFAPEHDPRFETLPICQFEADIVTDDLPEDFTGDFVDLHEDLGYGTTATNTLLAGIYEIYEAEQVGRGVVRVKAQSLLGWLENRTLDAKHYQGMSLRDFIGDLFTQLPMNDGEPIWRDAVLPFDLDSTPLSMYYPYVYGFCPVQTARERLQWVAQAYMLHVVQYGARTSVGLCITKSLDYPEAWQSIPNKLVRPENTYLKPIIKQANGYNAATLYFYGPFSETEIKAQDWTSSTLRREWDLTEQEWIDIPIYYRYQPVSRNDGTSLLGSVVEIKDNTLFYYTELSAAANYAAPYFRKYEAELDVLQIKEDGTTDTYVWPGDKVRFYVDPETVYEGIVKSASFTFGALARAKLVVSTDFTPVSVSYVELVFRFGNDENGFATRRYAFPAELLSDHINHIVVKNPQCYYQRDGEVEIIDPADSTTELYNYGAAGSTQRLYVTYPRPTI